MSYEAPYKGLKVVDLSQGVAGPYAGMLLAQYGADIIGVAGEFPPFPPATGRVVTVCRGCRLRRPVKQLLVKRLQPPGQIFPELFTLELAVRALDLTKDLGAQAGRDRLVLRQDDRADGAVLGQRDGGCRQLCRRGHAGDQEAGHRRQHLGGCDGRQRGDVSRGGDVRLF